MDGTFTKLILISTTSTNPPVSIYYPTIPYLNVFCIFINIVSISFTIDMVWGGGNQQTIDNSVKSELWMIRFVHIIFSCFI